MQGHRANHKQSLPAGFIRTTVLVYLAMLELRPPQRPRSEVMATVVVLGAEMAAMCITSGFLSAGSTTMAEEILRKQQKRAHLGGRQTGG